MFRPICRKVAKSTAKSSKGLAKQTRFYAGGHGHEIKSHGDKHDSHDHGHGGADHGHDAHGHDDHHHGPVPLKAPESPAFHLQEATPKGKVVATEDYFEQYVEGGGLDQYLATYESLAPELAGKKEALEKAISGTKTLAEAEAKLAEFVGADSPDWLLQFTGSKTVMEALAEFNTSELAFDIMSVSPKTLIEQYKVERSKFESTTVPQLKKENIPSRVIEHLRAIYELRATSRERDVEDGLLRLRNIFRRYPILKTKALVSGKQTIFWHRRYQLTRLGAEELFFRTKYDTDVTITERNVRYFRGWRALSEAFGRGLTDEEYTHVSTFFKKHQFSVEKRNLLNQEAGEVKYLIDTDKKKAEPYLRNLLEKYPLKSTERFYILDQLRHVDDVAAQSARKSDDGYDTSPLAIPEPSITAGEHPLSGAELIAALDKALAKEQEHAPIINMIKEKVSSIFADSNTARSLEILDLVKSAEPEYKDLDELYSYFLKTPNAGFPAEITDKLLADVLHPNVLSAKLFGSTIAFRSQENVQYTRDYADVGKILFIDDDTDENKALQANELDGEALPPPTFYPFATGYDELHHHKLLRLANDYYNFNTHTDVGMVQFELFQHAYDISHGEDTLDRVHPFPTPEHTYEELPIIKFDGYEDSDDPEIYQLGEGAKHHH